MSRLDPVVLMLRDRARAAIAAKSEEGSTRVRGAPCRDARGPRSPDASSGGEAEDSRDEGRADAPALDSFASNDREDGEDRRDPLRRGCAGGSNGAIRPGASDCRASRREARCFDIEGRGVGSTSFEHARFARRCLMNEPARLPTSWGVLVCRFRVTSCAHQRTRSGSESVSGTSAISTLRSWAIG